MGMTLTLKEVEHIAQLARLELTDEEKARYCDQLSAILDYAARLQTLDTADIPPTSSVLPARSVLREDVPGSSLPVEDVLRNAPSAEENQFRVPPVLE
jgi:aspartyl-tRNA(Asn)/glutamyl-tRNA(Gln) amidotransferase subunit C